jgi:HSP20 family protein
MLLTLAPFLFNVPSKTCGTSLFTSPIICREPAVASIQREMDSMIQEFDSMLDRPRWTRINVSPAVKPPSMSVDVTDNDKTFVIRAELPGVPKEAVTVEVLKNVVTIEASKEEKKEEKEEDGSRRFSERSYGQVKRSFGLPEGVLLDSAKCSFENGVLTVTFAKNLEVTTARKLLIE